MLDVSHLGTGGIVTADFLQAQNGFLRTADYVLLYTGWEKKWDTPAFLEEPFPILDEEAAGIWSAAALRAWAPTPSAWTLW